ncbi:response regulator transcription factor [Chryseobacterium sp. D764]|jgi:DNA-binding NarL/FixJ family response regulator|uniref:response regulator transcription factor n=1 Tax=unclassified Chryseobacterium TaxID=2593645 RepID=UPI0015C2901E|nr:MULTISPECIES: response regulator transcription factor [unclassified Chryseobacterium]QXU49645.1 response regulator transcription factor [Chryseobacterium sp. D764]CAD0225580.1 LuxR family two component transcriptional regulator [Chryseobacterium sp. JV274]
MIKKILIADDHDIVLTGTSIILESRIPNTVIDTAADYPEVLDKISGQKYDLLILDINMPESRNKKMISEIKSIQPEIRILVFSAYEEDIGVQYIKEGADGYINKLSKVDTISEAVMKMFAEGNYYPNGIVNKLLQPSALDGIKSLSEREYEIFILMVKGNGNLEISNEMEIQMSTISTYKKRIHKKLKTTNLADLIKLYEAYMS